MCIGVFNLESVQAALKRRFVGQKVLAKTGLCDHLDEESTQEFCVLNSIRRVNHKLG